ncbi:hypothetical protein K474DRAFT_1746392 [Panus rudis PR-1116 ss-1]|nr:hypothetical protein K474DRAFT_1746392 [Panus rudis PR-1116 ss-1]
MDGLLTKRTKYPSRYCRTVGKYSEDDSDATTNKNTKSTSQLSIRAIYLDDVPMHGGSTESTRTNTRRGSRARDNAREEEQLARDKSTSALQARKARSHSTTRPDDINLTSGTVPDKGLPKQGTPATERATVSTSGNVTKERGVQSLRERDPDITRLSDSDQDGNSNAKSQSGPMGTNEEQNITVEGNGGNARGRLKLSLGRERQGKSGDTGLSATPTRGVEEISGLTKATLDHRAVSPDSVAHDKEHNAVGMGLVSSGGRKGPRVAVNVDRIGMARDSGTSEDGARHIESTRSREGNGEAHSMRGKEGSSNEQTDVPTEDDGRTAATTKNASGRAGEKQATSALYGPDPKSVWSNKAPTPILVGGVPPSKLNTKRIDRERLSATPEPRRSTNMKKKGGKAPANGSMPPPPLPAHFSSPLTPTSALGTTPGSRSGSTPRPTTPTEWEPTSVSSPEVSLAGAISRAGKANMITYQKAKSATSMPANAVGPARKVQPPTKTTKTNDPNLARLQSARRREPTPTRDQVTHEGEPPILPLNNKRAPLTTFEEQERCDQARTRFRKNAERHAKNHLEIIEDAVPNEKSDEIAKKRTRQERKVAIRNKKNEEYLKELKEVNNIPNKFYIASQAFAKMAMFCMERRRCNQAGKRIMPGQTIMRRVYPSYYLQGHVQRKVGYTHLSCITPGAAKRLLSKNGSIQRVLFSEAFEKHADKVKVLNSLQTKAQRAPSSARVVRARARKVLGMKPLLNHSLMYRAKIVDRVMNACKEAQKVIRTKLLEIDSEMAQEKYEENLEKAVEPLDRLITYGDIVLDDGVPSKCQDIDMEADESHFDYSLLRGVNTWIYKPPKKVHKSPSTEVEDITQAEEDQAEEAQVELTQAEETQPEQTQPEKIEMEQPQQQVLDAEDTESAAGFFMDKGANDNEAVAASTDSEDDREDAVSFGSLEEDEDSYFIKNTGQPKEKQIEQPAKKARTDSSPLTSLPPSASHSPVDSGSKPSKVKKTLGKPRIINPKA